MGYACLPLAAWLSTLLSNLYQTLDLEHDARVSYISWLDGPPTTEPDKSIHQVRLGRQFVVEQLILT